MEKLKSYTPKQLKAIKKYWEILEEQTEHYYQLVQITENQMALDTGVEDIEFFKGEGQGFVGVGNVSRTFKLWQPKR